MIRRFHLNPRARRLAIWSMGHAARIWPFLLFAIVFLLSWHTVRHIHTREVRAALHSLSVSSLTVAAGLTGLNVVVMGFYDVLAFGHTRTRPSERWRYGAVAFAWSNFLTLGPLAGPAVRLWLYRDAADTFSELQAGLVSITVAFVSGLVGWIAALPLMPVGGWIAVAGGALIFSAAASWAGLRLSHRLGRTTHLVQRPRQPFELAAVGWLDWLLAALVFAACLRSTGRSLAFGATIGPFFVGQVIGLVSLIPGGFGTSDAVWIARLPLQQSVSAAALLAFRTIYYVGPWAIASLLLLAWATRRSPQRVDVARRIVAALVGGAGVLIVLSSASPALHARLVLLERHVPLPLVEVGQLAAALAGVVLLVLGRGLRRGYRTAFRATVTVLLLAAGASILKGLDWEESLILGAVAIAASSQAALFDRATRDGWLEGADLGVAFAALALFLAFGVVSHHLSAWTLERWTAVGYRLQGARFVRSAVSMTFGLLAASLYLRMRPAVRFEPPEERDIQRALEFHARFGSGTNPMMVATRDKSLFFDDGRGCCLYRTIGPYLAVFSDPVVRSPAERSDFLDTLLAFAAEIDRRLLMYQVSLDWVPMLHDRGFEFFKLGEEAHVHLDRLTLDGHGGKMARQILRRGDRDGATFRILEPAQVAGVLPELRDISDAWLKGKGVAERQFSIGAFDDDYLVRFRCAIVEQGAAGRGCILAFGNLLESPRGDELSVDLMRSRPDGPHVMDFLLMSLFLEGKRAGYQRFNLGMAPLASVGTRRGAHLRERLAGLMFQRGEQWYNFQGVRFYKEKFDPEWVPRYLAYPSAWEWPMAIASVSALVAGGWGSALRPARESIAPIRADHAASSGRA